MNENENYNRIMHSIRKSNLKNAIANLVIGNKKIFRLHYVNIHKIGSLYGLGYGHGTLSSKFSPFLLPDNMEREDAFKVLSYLTDYIESKYDIEECSLQSVKILDTILDIEELGFKKIEKISYKEDEIVDLYTIEGRANKFKRENAKKYFEWYTSGVTKDQVRSIYNKIGINPLEILGKIKIKKLEEN